ncbi:MAG: AIR synthase-related protein [Patescibacteria group bacterium]
MTTARLYEQAGVSLSAAGVFEDLVKARIEKAWPGGGDEIGGFAGGGLIPRSARRRVARLAASTDGAGTKPDIAAVLGRGYYKGVGSDAGAMALVDLYCAGHQPAFALDYLAVAKLVPEDHIEVIDGVIAACKAAGCRLIGGETAEHPGMFRRANGFDIAAFGIGFSAGTITGAVKAGQCVYGWPSKGPGANGYSLLRRVFGLNAGPRTVLRRLAKYWSDLDDTLADALMVPTQMYIDACEAERKLGTVFAAHAHITGGGLVENIPRILPSTLKVVLNRDAWDRPPILRMAQFVGQIDPDEMDHVFNQGIQMVSVVENGELRCSPRLRPVGESAIQIGQVVNRRGDEPQVEFRGTFAGELHTTR